MTFVVLAMLAVIAPPGWVQDREPAPLAEVASETQRFHAPDDPESIYVVSRLDYVGDSTIADIANRYVPPPGETNTQDVDGVTIVDFWRTAPDGRRAHLRTLKNPDRAGALVGLCVGRGAAFDACEAKLGTLSIGRTQVDSTHAFKLVGWIFLVLVALSAIGLGIRALLRRRELARSPELVDGEPVTISGVARPLTTVIDAPLSGARCLGYRARVRLFDRAGELGERVETKLLGFEVATRRGAIQVLTDEVELAVPPTAIVDTRSSGQLAFRERHDVGTASVAFDEIAILPGSRVMLRGIVRRTVAFGSAIERGYRDEPPSTLQLVGRDREPVRLLKIW